MNKTELILILVIGIFIGLLSAGITSIAQDVYFHDTMQSTLFEGLFYNQHDQAERTNN